MTPMKISPQQFARMQTKQTLPTDAPQSPEWDAMFQDALQAESAKWQRVVSAEEVLADLDGTPTLIYGDSNGNDPAAADPVAPAASIPAARQTILEKIDRIARSYGVDVDLVREVVRAESNFNPHAVSRSGAKGLMQLMDSTARMLRVRNAYDPEQNLVGGTKYLRDLLQRFDGNVKVALAAYNAGPGRIQKLGIDTDEELEAKFSLLPQETQRYVEKITQRLG